MQARCVRDKAGAWNPSAIAGQDYVDRSELADEAGAGSRPLNHRGEVTVMRVRAWIVLFAVGLATGCSGSFLIGPPAILGSGVSEEEARAVDAFHALDVGNALRVIVSVTSGAKPGVKISGDDNLVPLVESFIRNGTLILRVKDDSTISPKLPLLAEVVAGELDGVDVSGAASLKVKGGLKVNRFSASASGAAQVSVEGVESSQAVASATGASQIVLSGSTASLKVGASGRVRSRPKRYRWKTPTSRLAALQVLHSGRTRASPATFRAHRNSSSMAVPRKKPSRSREPPR